MEAKDYVRIAEQAKKDNCLALLSTMKEFYSNNEFFDVTLQVEDRLFKSHQFALAALSKYFHRMFGGNFRERYVNKEEPIILQDINAKAFEVILNFLYSGNVSITSIYDIYPVLVTADFLQLRTPYIETECIGLIRENLEWAEPIPGAIKIFKFSCATKKAALTDLLRRHIFIWMCQLSTEDTFESLSYEDLKELLQGYPLWMKDQDTVLTFIIKWVHHSHKERKHVFKELIKLPDLEKISSHCLVSSLNEYEKLINRIEEEPGTADDGADGLELLSSPNPKFELTITFAKDNFLALRQSERCVSPQYVGEDLSWRILVFRKAKTNCLAAFLQCGGHPENKYWKCSVKFKLSILLQEKKQGSDHTPFEREIGLHEFNHKEADWGWSDFILWNKLIDPENGYIKDNIVIFQAHLIFNPSSDE